MIFQECPDCARLYIFDDAQDGEVGVCADCAGTFAVDAARSIDHHSVTLLNVDDGRTMDADAYKLRERGVPDRFVVVSSLTPGDWVRLVQHLVRQRDEAVGRGR